MRFRCPACSAVLSAPADLAGEEIRCTQCDVLLEVPRPAAAKTPAPAPAAASAPGAAVPPKPSARALEQAADNIAEEAPISFGKEKKVVRDEMDMTPMVDVTFLLLIFFMVTAAFSMQKSFEVPTPNEDQPSTQTRTIEDFEEDPDYVVVRIDEYNTYHISAAAWDEEQEVPSKQELLEKLRTSRRPKPGGKPATRMLVMAHGDALHETVVTALDSGTAVGMEEVKLLTVEGDE